MIATDLCIIVTVGCVVDVWCVLGRVLAISHPLPSDYLFVTKRRGAAPLHLQASTHQPSPSTWLGRTETRRTRACDCSRLLRLFSVLAPVQRSYACSACLHPLGVVGWAVEAAVAPGPVGPRLSASRLSCFTIGKTYHIQNSEAENCYTRDD